MVKKALMQWIGETKEDREGLILGYVGALVLLFLFILDIQYNVNYVWEISMPFLISFFIIRIKMKRRNKIS